MALPKEKAEPDDFCSDDFDPKEKPPVLAVEFFGDWLKAPKIEVAGFVSDLSDLEFRAGEPKLKPPKAEPRLSPAALSWDWLVLLWGSLLVFGVSRIELMGGVVECE